MVNATARPSYPRKKPWYPCYNRFAASCYLSRRVWKISPAPGVKSPKSSGRSESQSRLPNVYGCLMVSQILCSSDDTTASLIPYRKITESSSVVIRPSNYQRPNQALTLLINLVWRGNVVNITAPPLMAQISSTHFYN